MACNIIHKAITTIMPPRCFYCSVWDYDAELGNGYCWLLHRRTERIEKPNDCPLIEIISADLVKPDGELVQINLQESEDA